MSPKPPDCASPLPDTDALKRRNLNTVPDGRAGDFLRFMAESRERRMTGIHLPDCIRSGYAPPGYELADFSIIRHDGAFHVFHIPRVPGNSVSNPCNEHWFGHAVSRDLDTWTTLDSVLANEPKNPHEAAQVWAPFVFPWKGEHHMFYTGLSNESSQVLCHAVSRDPELKVWERVEPNPCMPWAGFDWQFRNDRGHLRHGRDPHVVRTGNHFLMAYSTMHANGCPVIGGLVSDDLFHWHDIGPLLFRPFGPYTWMAESVNIQPLPDGTWVLIPSAGGGLEYYISDDPHHWHGCRPTRIEYVNGDGAEPLGLELIRRSADDSEWLVAFFQQPGNRLFTGILSKTAHPWTLRRCTAPSELAGLL